MIGKYEVATKVYDDSYTIELYVPLMGEEMGQVYDSIGFNVSVDDYHEESGSRVSYTYWSAYGEYWLYPSELAEVMLVDAVMSEDENENIEDEPENNTTDSSNIESESSSGNTEDENVSQLENFGCFLFK